MHSEYQKKSGKNGFEIFLKIKDQPFHHSCVVQMLLSSCKRTFSCPFVMERDSQTNACTDAAILSLILLPVPNYFTHIPAKCCPRPQTTIHHTSDICCSSIAMHWMATARQPSSGNVIATSVEQDAQRAKPLFMRRSVDTFSCNISATTTDVIGDQTAANFGMTLFLLLLSYNICISCSCWTECSSRPP